MLIGSYVTTEAPGALRNATLVRRTRKRKGDAHGVGATARIIGSIGPMPAGHDHAGLFYYYVEWTDTPGVAVGILGDVIEAVT